MRLFPRLLIGLLVACHGNLLAQDAALPPAAPPSSPEQEADLHDLPEDLEEIRRALGPDYSIDSQELDLPYDRPRGAGPAVKVSEKTKEISPRYEGEQQNTIDQELKEASQAIRMVARRLERLAADAEEQSHYAKADQLRDIARNQWQSARAIAALLPESVADPGTAAYSRIAGPPRQSDSEGSTYVAPWAPPFTWPPQTAPGGPSRWHLPASQPPIPPFPNPQVDGDP